MSVKTGESAQSGVHRRDFADRFHNPSISSYPNLQHGVFSGLPFYTSTLTSLELANDGSVVEKCYKHNKARLEELYSQDARDQRGSACWFQLHDFIQMLSRKAGVHIDVFARTADIGRSRNARPGILKKIAAGDISGSATHPSHERFRLPRPIEFWFPLFTLQTQCIICILVTRIKNTNDILSMLRSETDIHASLHAT